MNNYTMKKFEHDYGNYIEVQRQRNQAVGLGPIRSKDLRYCETCERYAKRDNRPVVKGWKCEACRDA